MWLLHFLPDSFLAFVVNAVLVAGVISTLLTCFFLKYVVRLIPAFAPHIKIAQIISVAVLLAGVYFRGGYSTEMLWRERVAEVEARLAAAAEESRAENVKIETRIVKKTEYITRRGQDIIQYVDREIVKYDNKFGPGGICEIPTEFIQAHNRAAEALPK